MYYTTTVNPIKINKEKREELITTSHRFGKSHRKKLARMSKKHASNDSAILRYIIENAYEVEFPSG